MAGDWIKWTKGLSRKSEVLQIADSLNMECAQVAGHLMEFWEWVDDNCKIDDSGNGHVTCRALHAKRIDRIIHVTGFADALIDARWLIIENDRMLLPNFGRHNGKTAKSRAVTNNRVASHRNGDVTLPVTVAPLPEKRRVEKSIKTPLPLKGFEEFWAAYPKKKARVKALEAWNKLKLSEKLDEILKAIQWQKRSEDWTKDGGQFIPYPASYLRSSRWLDEPDMLATAVNKPSTTWHRHATGLVDDLKRLEGCHGKELEDLVAFVASKKSVIAEGGEAAKKYLRENVTPWGLKIIQSAWKEHYEKAA